MEPDYKKVRAIWGEIGIDGNKSETKRKSREWELS